jgi:hypothetical protein
MATVLSKNDVGSLPTTFTTRLALADGLHPRKLYRLRADGVMIELSQGVFRRADAPPATWQDLFHLSRP